MSVCTTVQVRGENATLDAKNEIVSFSPSYRALPRFQDVPRSEQPALFFKKLDLCSVVFDFEEPTKNAKEKKTKRLALEEIVKYLETATNKFTEDLIQEVIKMVSVNLFRSQIHSRKENQVFGAFGSDDNEPFMDPSWPHLELVYEFFLKFLKSRGLDTRLATKYVDSSFILKLLDLFDSEDPREREFLNGILHYIYSKFSKHQPFLKKAIENILYEFIYESKKHNGIAELLEILGSIIVGFISPLKEEHKLFLVKVLLPLHKSSSIKMYHQQLCYCVTQFVEKDVRLAETVIRGLLKYWPTTNSSKEVMFLQELEEVLEATSSIEFDNCMIPLSRRIARCLDNSHYQVAERVLSLWKNYHIERLMEENMESILPILYPALKRNARQHWNRSIQKLTRNVIHIFSYHDQELFKECVRIVEKNKAREERALSKREATWKRLEEIAASRTICNTVNLASQQAY